MSSAPPVAAVTDRPKTLAESKQWMHQRLKSRFHPMNALSLEEGPNYIDGVPGLDGQRWGDYWYGHGEQARAAALQAEAEGDRQGAAALYQKASGLFFMGRFPCPNHPAKARCAIAERASYISASRYWREPIERIEVPFAGKEGEGSSVVVLLRRPLRVQRPKVVLMWGGVDACKEQMTAACDALLEKGIATVAMDNAGTGESPVKGVPDAERQFISVLDWLAAQETLDGARPACLGRSFGGYWATKLAHLLPERLTAAVNWGGGVHHMFQPEWVQASRYPDSYLMELVETRSLMLGARNDEEYVQGFGRLSLLDQDLLDRPCAPLLLVNGKQDKQCPVADIELLLEHGWPKSVRMFPGGHMGLTPQTLPTIVDWLARHLHAGRPA